MFSTELHSDILADYVICFFYARPPLRSCITILFFTILSLVRLCIFSERQNTFFIIIIRMLIIYLITLQRTLEENAVEQMDEYWKGITEYLYYFWKSAAIFSYFQIVLF